MTQIFRRKGRVVVKLKRSGLGTKILILVLLVAAVTALLSMRTQLAAAQSERDALRAQVQAQVEQNSALADAIAHSDDPEYIANIARNRLGLLEPDELRFVDTSK